MHPTLCDMLADITQNAFEAGAAHVALTIAQRASRLSVTVKDDGCGMSPETKARALDPFYTAPGKHPSRKVGLGLPFLKMTTDLCGGTLDIDTAPGVGTTISFTLDLSNVDTPPMGDLPSLFVTLMNYPGAHDLAIRREAGDASYDISRADLAAALDDPDLTSSTSLALMRDFFATNEEELRASAEAESASAPLFRNA